MTWASGGRLVSRVSTQFLCQCLKGRVLVRVRFEGYGSNASKQFPEAGATAKVDSDHQGVDECADEFLRQTYECGWQLGQRL